MLLLSQGQGYGCRGGGVRGGIFFFFVWVRSEKKVGKVFFLKEAFISLLSAVSSSQILKQRIKRKRKKRRRRKSRNLWEYFFQRRNL